MAKFKEPPFYDPPNPNNRFWSQSWYEWLREVWKKVNGIDNVIDRTFPIGDIVGTTDTQTLTNKSFPDPTDELHAVNLRYADANYINKIGDQKFTGDVEGVTFTVKQGANTWDITRPVKVGQLVMFTDGTNPATAFGYGSWALLGTTEVTIK